MRQLYEEKEHSEFKPVKLRLKTDFVSYPTRAEGLVNMVLWHINHCWLFNAKSCFYIYIKYIGFGFGRFYGISTMVGYLMLNLVYTYVLDIYDLIWLGFMAYQL